MNRQIGYSIGAGITLLGAYFFWRNSQRQKLKSILNGLLHVNKSTVLQDTPRRAAWTLMFFDLLGKDTADPLYKKIIDPDLIDTPQQKNAQHQMVWAVVDNMMPMSVVSGFVTASEESLVEHLEQERAYEDPKLLIAQFQS